MIDIAQHIEFLLLHHDCVVVPGLGAFIVNDEGARYDSRRHVFMPPSRTVGFNPEVRHNDAMLIGSISRRNGISLSAARMDLETEVASLHHQLDVAGEFPLGGLGMLMRGASPEYPVFEPAADSLPLRMCKSFASVDCCPLVSDDSTEDGGACARQRIVAIPAPLKIVASFIVVMVALGILYSTTGLINGPKVNSASLDTGLSSRIEQSAPVFEVAADEDVSREIVLNIAMPAEQPDMAQSDCAAEQPEEAPQRYLLVVGSFPTLASANRHIYYVGDTSLRVIEMAGNYRIYVASAPTIEEARRLSAYISKTYPSVWVCRR